MTLNDKTRPIAQSQMISTRGSLAEEIVMGAPLVRLGAPTD